IFHWAYRRSKWEP
ncbi:hypothetical protein SCA6_019375, partial [Theobroma cacao]